MASGPPSPTSPLPFHVSEDLAPLRAAKPAGQTHLSFSGLLAPPLILNEDLKDGCGGQLWPAGILLARYLLQRLDQLRGKTIIELGAGGGLTGLALASALSRGQSLSDSNDTAPPLLITDLPQMLPLQETNIRLNDIPEISIKSMSLPWGSPLPEDLPAVYKQPDIILAADCVYFEPAFPLLIETLRTLFGSRVENNDDGKDPVCWFCMKKRRKADMRFIAVLRKAFSVREVEVELEVGEKGIHLYEVHRK